MHMDTPAKAALGGGLISTLAIGGMVAAGVLATSATVVLTDPAAPPAGAAGLAPFGDCDSLLDWYVDHSLDEVGPWGWGGRVWPMLAEDQSARESVDSATPSDGVSNGSTGTNTQEADVDEPDVAKTDGRIVVRLQDGRRLVVTDVTGDEPRELADWRLPGTAYADGLLLVDDHVLLGASNQVMGREGFVAPDSGGTELYDVDLSDPADPRLEDIHRWSGRQLSMRQYGDTVRLVTTIGLPSLPFVQPDDRRNEAEAEQRNRQVVRDSRIEDWVPGLECGEVYHPEKWSGPDTVAVTTFRPDSSDDATRVAVTGAGSEVYSSADRLYVTSTDWDLGPVPLVDGPDTTVRSDIIRPEQKTRTHIHAFALAGPDTRYVASGVVNGTVRNRWSLDEHDGHLRVAVSWPSRSGSTRDNGVVVLDENDGRLEQVGELAGLGPDEDIQSVRWFDDLAVVVTFRQMDPLYTIDLTDPTRPVRLGELKIPGFSAYLHPIGDDRLLGLGSDATPDRSEPGGPGGRVRHQRRHPCPPGRQGHVRVQLVRGGGGPARVHLAAGRARRHCRDAARIGFRPPAAAGRVRRVPVVTRAASGRWLGPAGAAPRGRPRGPRRRPGAHRRAGLSLRRSPEKAASGMRTEPTRPSRRRAASTRANRGMNGHQPKSAGRMARITSA